MEKYASLTVYKPTEPNPENAIGIRCTPFHEHQYAAYKIGYIKIKPVTLYVSCT